MSDDKTRPVGSNQAAPAARANFRLLLLPSDPDKIHGMVPHGTQSSSPTDWIIIAQLFGKCNPRRTGLTGQAGGGGRAPERSEIGPL